jgi:polyketide cyclase/dehydrase/lipid transport protein
VKVTAREVVFVAAPPERVWEFTQDWTRRHQWDPAVVAAEYLEREPPVVRVRGAGGVRFLARYKLFDKPARTSVAMTESSSRIVTGGGGAWVYEPAAGGTRFAQANTLTFPRWAFLIAPFLSWTLRRATRKALQNAKRMLEAPH